MLITICITTPDIWNDLPLLSELTNKKGTLSGWKESLTYRTDIRRYGISFPKGRHCRFQQYPVANRHGDDPGRREDSERVIYSCRCKFHAHAAEQSRHGNLAGTDSVRIPLLGITFIPHLRIVTV